MHSTGAAGRGSVAVLVGFMMGAAGIAGDLRADVLRWTNPAGGSFTTPTNWDLGRVPGAADNVVFDLTGAYTVQFPASPTTTPVNGMDVLAGEVTFQGGKLVAQLNGADHRVRVGTGAAPATLRLNGHALETSSAVITVEAQGAVITTNNGTVYTFGSPMRVLPGGLVRAESGYVSPLTLRIEGGRAESTGGALSGGGIDIFAGSVVRASGVNGRLGAQDWINLRGDVRIENGSRLWSNLGGFVTYNALGCNLVIGAGGSSTLPKFVSDNATVVRIESGGNWDGGLNSEYRGVFTADAGSTVLVSGIYYTAPSLDQGGTNQQSGFAAFNAGLNATVDGTLRPPPAVVRRSASPSGQTHVAGPLTVSVRHPNALRVGDVIPVLESNPGGTGGFSSLSAPVLGGGRLLQMFVQGEPETTYVRVVQTEPSCYLNADFNGDGDVGTDQDIEAFFACIGGTCCVTCASADFNGDGDVGTDQDIEAFFHVLGGGSC